MRKHVFPICQTGSEKKEWSNPIDSNIQGSTTRFISENKDIVSLSLTSAPNNVKWSWVMLNGSKGEFLIDIPDVTYSGGNVVSSGAAILYRFINAFSDQDSFKKPLKENNFEPPVAGQIACIAVKRLDSAYDNSQLKGFDPYVYQKEGDYFNFNYLFSEEGTYQTGFDQTNPKVGGWVTSMFTGTRWVLLGSNNWY